MVASSPNRSAIWALESSSSARSCASETFVRSGWLTVCEPISQPASMRALTAETLMPLEPRLFSSRLSTPGQPSAFSIGPAPSTWVRLPSSKDTTSGLAGSSAPVVQASSTCCIVTAR
jgi:hypothetical protein